MTKAVRRVLETVIPLAAALAFWLPPTPTVVSVPTVPPSPPEEFWRAPTMQIGLPEGMVGSEVTPEGDIYTGFQEFYLLYGYQGLPGRRCSKSLLGGEIPVVRCFQRANYLLYTLESFGASLNGRDDGPLIDMVAVTITNPGPRARQAYLTASFRFRGPGPYRPKPRLPFDPRWTYRFRGDEAVRGDQILGWAQPGSTRREGFPGQAFQDEVEQIQPTRSHEFLGSDEGIGPASPVLRSQYAVQLPPFGQRRLIFEIPHPPLDLEQGRALARLDYDVEKRRVIARWQAILERSARLETPDRKIDGLAGASVANLFIGLDRQPPWLVPRVNELQYDGFYLRDGAYMVRALDLMGYAREAEECLDYFLSRQKPDGLFLSQRGQLDGWGEAVWALGQHVRITGDLGFARRAFPSIKRAVDWLIRTRRSTLAAGGPGAGLLPAADPHDNEQIGGHLFGNDFWAYGGLSEAVEMARELGERTEQAAWTREKDGYRRAIDATLRTATARTGGFIPPALEPGGFDWGNLKAADPCRVLAPDDPRVRATAARARSAFNQGLPTYARRDSIHGYVGFDLFTTELRESDERSREAALDALFSEAAHTTAANGGFEYGSVARRDYGKNLSPHGCWAAEYLAYLRDCLIREEGGTLHLASAISPAWVEPGEAVRVENAPTDFGPVSYTLIGTVAGARLNLRLPDGRRASRLDRVVFHAPPGTRIAGARVVGGGAEWDAESATLAPRTQSVDLTWTLPADSGRWTSGAYLDRYCLPAVLDY